MNKRKFILITGILCLLLFAGNIESINNSFSNNLKLEDSLNTAQDTEKTTTPKIEAELDKFGYLNFKSYRYSGGSETASNIAINIRNELSEVNKKPFDDLAANPYLWEGDVGSAVVFIAQYGVFAVQPNKNIETSKPYYVLDEKVENYDIKPYPKKKDWAIIDINGKPKLVIYTVKRGLTEIPEIREYNPKKDG